jgi:hypothetical protein
MSLENISHSEASQIFLTKYNYDNNSRRRRRRCAWHVADSGCKKNIKKT